MDYDVIKKCDYFLSECLKFGWRKTDLDFLEKLWWKYRDENGELFPRIIYGKISLTNAS